jgi:hypothetical protein
MPNVPTTPEVANMQTIVDRTASALPTSAYLGSGDVPDDGQPILKKLLVVALVVVVVVTLIIAFSRR